MPVSTLYISGGISDIAICENNLIATGPDASVYIYDVRTWKPICKHVDEGAVYSTKVALGKSVYATGYFYFSICILLSEMTLGQLIFIKLQLQAIINPTHFLIW